MTRAFTLLELSIVLVIIGLIVGGVVAGQSLIRNSELNAIASDLQQWETAIQTFSYKYNAIPGDIGNATLYWPGQTTNGNNNGVHLTYTESFKAWQHLALAGIIPGSYTGVSASGGSCSGNCNATIGENVPAGPINGTGYTFWASNTGGNYFNNSAENFIFFGKKVADSYTYGTVLTTAEALAIDRKIDNGAPGLGKIKTWANHGTLANCHTSLDAQTAQYDLSYQDTACHLLLYY